MLRFTFRRILMMIPVLLGVLIIVFTLSYLMPGDPVLNKLGDSYTQEQYDEVAHEMGLDQPYLVRLGDYIVGVVTRFDLGTSYQTNRPVAESVLERVWTTVSLGLLSTCVTVLLGIPFGIISAINQKKAPDYVITVFSIFLASVPGFWLAMMGMLLFSLRLGWLPASGLSTWKHYILPVFCNAMMSLANVTRITRSSMLGVIRQDYIRTARSKGIAEQVIIVRHVLKNALIPVITVVGGQMSMIIGGSVIIEQIFNINGLGTLMVNAINNRDYPVIMGITLIIAIFVSVMNLIVDLAYAFFDPRVKAQFSHSAARKTQRSRRKEATG